MTDTQPELFQRLHRLHAEAQPYLEAEEAADRCTRQIVEVAQRRSDALELMAAHFPAYDLLQRVTAALETLLGGGNDTAPIGGVAELEEMDVPTGPIEAELEKPIEPDLAVPSADPDPPAEKDATSQDAATDAPSSFDQLRAWVLDQGNAPITADQASSALGLAGSTARNYLAKLWADGLLIRQPGTGRVGVPSVYLLESELPVIDDNDLVLTPPPPTRTPPAPVAAAQPAPAKRDLSDRQAIRSAVPTEHGPVPVKPSKPVTASDERAVLSALFELPVSGGSPARMSRTAGMGTSRVTEVLEHLAGQGLVLRPPDGEYLWKRV